MESKSAIGESGPLKVSDNPAGTAHPEGAIVADSIAKDAPRDGARRRLTKLGLGAPVLMTLASRPVLAAQCLSAQMSGNLSKHEHSGCVKGTSPGGWANPGGNIGSLSTVGAWTRAGFSFGDYATNSTQTKINKGAQSQCQPSQADCYDGGSKLSDVPSELNQNNLPTTMLLRDVLKGDGHENTPTRHLVAAYLNACLSANSGLTTPYILTKQQVIDLANPSTPIPGGIALNTFLDSTWGNSEWLP